MANITNINDLQIKYIQPKIEYDLSALKEEINNLNEKYKNLVLKQDDVKEIKQELAIINKLIEAIKRKRIDTAKEIKKPITSFEDEVKAFEKTLDETYRSLKNQIDTFIEEEKEEKRKLILALPEYVEEYMCFDESWLSKNKTIKSIKEEIESQRQNFENQLLMIKTTCTALGLNPDKYRLLLVERKPIEEIIDLINNDKQVKEQYANEVVEQTASITKDDVSDTDIYTFSLEVKGTRAQLIMLKEFMSTHKIEFRKIENESD